MNWYFIVFKLFVDSLLFVFTVSCVSLGSIKVLPSLQPCCNGVDMDAGPHSHSSMKLVLSQYGRLNKGRLPHHCNPSTLLYHSNGVVVKGVSLESPWSLTEVSQLVHYLPLWTKIPKKQKMYWINIIEGTYSVINTMTTADVVSMSLPLSLGIARQTKSTLWLLGHIL